MHEWGLSSYKTPRPSLTNIGTRPPALKHSLSALPRVANSSGYGSCVLCFLCSTSRWYNVILVPLHLAGEHALDFLTILLESCQRHSRQRELSIAAPGADPHGSGWGQPSRTTRARKERLAPITRPGAGMPAQHMSFPLPADGESRISTWAALCSRTLSEVRRFLCSSGTSDLHAAKEMYCIVH